MKTSGDLLLMPLRKHRSETNGLLPVPMYHQIYLVMKEQIADSRFDPSRPLPSEHELAAHFAVSRVTLRSALERLAREGLIVRQRGRGTFVRSGATGGERGELSGLLENLVATGLKTTVRVVELDVVPAPVDVGEALAVAAGTPVCKAVRVRGYRGVPVALLTTYVPEAIGRGITRRDLIDRPMLALLEATGIRVADATQRISARLADTSAATLLDVELGAALLSVSRVVRDVGGQPVQLLRGLYRPDRYQYEMQLTRRDDEQARIWVGADSVST